MPAARGPAPGNRKNTMSDDTVSNLDKLKSSNPKLWQQVANSWEYTMRTLNGRIGQVKIGGKVRFIDLEDKVLSFYSKADMGQILAHVQVLSDEGKPTSAFRWWSTREDRKQYSEVVFEPNEKKAPAGALNLFRGFTVKPTPLRGGCTLFYDHLYRNVCNGDDEHYDFLLDWFAHLFQRPGAKVGVAPVLYGSKGCGKSIVGEVLAACIGPEYCPAIDTPDQLTGKHNAHLGKAVLIRVEEAIHAKDPRHEARIKHMITGGRFMVEPKGVDAFEIDSKANLIFSTNKLHSVPATAGERRFFALHVADHNLQDGDFFGRLLKQMRTGGYGAMVADLLARDISGRDFARPPRTALLSRQIVETMSGLERWWLAVLVAGRLPFTRDPEAPDEDVEWPVAGLWLTPKALMQDSAASFARDYSGPPTPEAIGKFLAGNVPGLTRDRRQSGGSREHLYIVPPLEDCRAAFVAARPGLRLEDVMDAIPIAGATTVANDSGVAASAATGGRLPRELKAPAPRAERLRPDVPTRPPSRFFSDAA